MRDKSNTYKKKRVELTELRTELGILAHTLEILKENDSKLTEQLVSLEEQKGIKGYFSMQEAHGKNSDINEESEEELKMKIKEFNDLINERKAKLAPSVKDLRPLRQKSQDLQVEFDQKKAAYDAVAAGLESDVHKLEQEISKLQEKLSSLESKQYLMKCNTEYFEVHQKMLDDEIKFAKAKDQEIKDKSFK